MKHLLFLFSTIFIFGCKNEPTIDYALFSGKIENVDAEKIMIEGTDFDKELKINSDGAFSDSLKLTESGFYTLKIGRQYTQLYLKNGFNLNMNLDAQAFDKSLQYSGEGSIENNYLAAKILKNETTKADPTSFYGQEEADFKSNIATIKQDNTKALEALKSADAQFVSLELKNLEYDAYVELSTYGSAHSYYAKIPDYKVSDEFLPSELKTLKFDDVKAYNYSSSYKNLAYRNTLEGIFETIGEDYNNATVEDLEGINNIKITALKEDIIDYLGKFMISPSNPNMKSIHDFLAASTSKEETKSSLTDTYEKNKNLVVGMPSPQFVNYENHKGGNTSLNELKGKYVYIDVWATWCGPCKREIPFLKEIEKKYHGKNIEFVSTSIDVAKDYNTWVEMVEKEQLGGMQLIADNDWQSKFVTDYAIEGIPRFILVDPEGNIVSADAPRPSDPKLVELLKELKI